MYRDKKQYDKKNKPLFSCFGISGSGGTCAVDNKNLAALRVKDSKVVGFDILNLNALGNIKLGDVDNNLARHVGGQSLDIEAFLLVLQLATLHNSD